jgi:hypothetical protein
MVSFAYQFLSGDARKPKLPDFFDAYLPRCPSHQNLVYLRESAKIRKRSKSVVLYFCGTRSVFCGLTVSRIGVQRGIVPEC